MAEKIEAPTEKRAPREQTAFHAGEPLYKRSIVLITAALSIVTATAADAQHRHRHHKSGRINPAVIVCDHRGCLDRSSAVRARVSRVADANGNAVILGGRPAGCPHSFCGCEASRYVFGEIRPELYLASNWIRKFPRAAPAPGMARHGAATS